MDISLSAVKNAKYVIAQVNPNMPRTHGDGILHHSEINCCVAVDDPLPEINYGKNAGETESLIGKHCAALIEDGSTLQMGIGSIPDAVMGELYHHKDLGVHTEMFSDGVVNLCKAGLLPINIKRSIAER